MRRLVRVESIDVSVPNPHRVLQSPVPQLSRHVTLLEDGLDGVVKPLNVSFSVPFVSGVHGGQWCASIPRF